MEVLIIDKKMNINQNKEQTAKTSDVQLLRPGVVKIPYTSQGKKLDIVVYNEDNGFTIRINEFKNNVRKKIKDKETPLPKQTTNLIKKEQTDLMSKIGLILDYYVGKKRLRIPEKVRETYKLLTEKNRTAEVIKQKSIEIKKNIESNKTKISKEEETKIKKAFQGKSRKEIKENIKIKNNPELMKIIKKIGLGLGILTISSGLIRAIWTQAQKDAKSKRVYDTEQGIDPKKNDSNVEESNEWEITPPLEEKLTTEKLQQSIAPEKLQGVTYENIMNTVENITNPKTKGQVINLLKWGDIVGVQELYGMKISSEYSSNKATWILDKNTIKKMSNPLFGLAGQEFIDNENIPNEVKEIYQEFLNGQISNDNLAYLILSKKTCKEYLFDKDNKLLDIQTILIGADLGNKNQFMPYDHYKVAGNKKIYVRGKINRNTPTGLFKVKKTIELSSDYKIDGPKRGINIVPIDAQGNEEVRFKYTQWGLAIHPIYQQPSNPKKYENAMKSASIQDNSITHGCPNIEGFGTAFDNLELWSKVVICTE